MVSLRRLLSTAVLGTVASLPSLTAADPPAIPLVMPGDSSVPLPQPSPVPGAPPSVSTGAVPPASSLSVSESCDTPSPLAACLPSCPPVCRTHVPFCGPRLRLLAPAPQAVRRPVCSSPACESPVTAPSAPGFGTAPARPASIQPTMTTVQVPYTYMVPVPTFAMMPTTSFGAAPTIGFGAAPAVGFGGVSQFGSVGGFGTVQTAGGFGAAPAGLNEAALRNLVAAAMRGQSREGGFGAAGDGEDACKKELAAMNARIDKLRSDLDELRVALSESKQLEKQVLPKIVSSLDDHATLLKSINAKLGEGAEGKSLTAALAEVNAKLEKLKKENNLK